MRVLSGVTLSAILPAHLSFVRFLHPAVFERDGGLGG
jgi:hypothetical protein